MPNARLLYTCNRYDTPTSRRHSRFGRRRLLRARRLPLGWHHRTGARIAVRRPQVSRRPGPPRGARLRAFACCTRTTSNPRSGAGSSVMAGASNTAAGPAMAGSTSSPASAARRWPSSASVTPNQLPSAPPRSATSTAPPSPKAPPLRSSSPRAESQDPPSPGRKDCPEGPRWPSTTCAVCRLSPEASRGCNSVSRPASVHRPAPAAAWNSRR